MPPFLIIWEFYVLWVLRGSVSTSFWMFRILPFLILCGGGFLPLFEFWEFYLFFVLFCPFSFLFIQTNIFNQKRFFAFLKLIFPLVLLKKNYEIQQICRVKRNVLWCFLQDKWALRSCSHTNFWSQDLCSSCNLESRLYCLDFSWLLPLTWCAYCMRMSLNLHTVQCW